MVGTDDPKAEYRHAWHACCLTAGLSRRVRRIQVATGPTHRDALAADVICIADSGQWAPACGGAAEWPTASSGATLDHKGGVVPDAADVLVRRPSLALRRRGCVASMHQRQIGIDRHLGLGATLWRAESAGDPPWLGITTSVDASIR